MTLEGEREILLPLQRMQQQPAKYLILTGELPLAGLLQQREVWQQGWSWRPIIPHARAPLPTPCHLPGLPSRDRALPRPPPRVVAPSRRAGKHASRTPAGAILASAAASAARRLAYSCES